MKTCFWRSRSIVDPNLIKTLHQTISGAALYPKYKIRHPHNTHKRLFIIPPHEDDTREGDIYGEEMPTTVEAGGKVQSVDA